MADTALGGWVRLAARSRASVRPSARSRATASIGRSLETLARIRARASATESSRSLFIVHSPAALDYWLGISTSNKDGEAVVGRKHLLQKLGIPALMLTITAAAYGQNGSPWDGTKPPPPGTRKM